MSSRSDDLPQPEDDQQVNVSRRMEVSAAEKQVLIEGHVKLQELARNSTTRHNCLESICAQLNTLRPSDTNTWSIQRVSKWFSNHKNMLKNSTQRPTLSSSAEGCRVRAFVSLTEREQEIAISPFRRASKKLKLDPQSSEIVEPDATSDIDENSDHDSTCSVSAVEVIVPFFLFF